MIHFFLSIKFFIIIGLASSLFFKYEKITHLFYLEKRSYDLFVETGKSEGNKSLFFLLLLKLFIRCCTFCIYNQIVV